MPTMSSEYIFGKFMVSKSSKLTGYSVQNFGFLSFSGIFGQVNLYRQVYLYIKRYVRGNLCIFCLAKTGV